MAYRSGLTVAGCFLLHPTYNPSASHPLSTSPYTGEARGGGRLLALLPLHRGGKGWWEVARSAPLTQGRQGWWEVARSAPLHREDKGLRAGLSRSFLREMRLQISKGRGGDQSAGLLHPALRQQRPDPGSGDGRAALLLPGDQRHLHAPAG